MIKQKGKRPKPKGMPPIPTAPPPKRGFRAKRCKDCKWFLAIPKKYAKKYKSYGRCIHLTMMDDIIFLRGGKEISGGYIAHEDFGCIEYEGK